VTYNALFNDREKKLKTPLYGRNLAAVAGILDADFLRTCPPVVIASTGMDALTHAIESYTNTNAHPMVDTMAIGAIEMIGANLRAAASGRDPRALQNQLVAATTAAIPLNLCGVGLVHAMSNPLSGHFNVAHGIANSILLPVVMEYNRIGCEEKYARIAQALGESIEGLSVHEAARIGVQAVRDLLHDLPLPRTLGDVGVEAKAIPVMVEDTFRSRNIEINPRLPIVDDVADLFAQAIGE
jgi:alcohol dehydrogenase class IV